jgi:hypothetical protein
MILRFVRLALKVVKDEEFVGAILLYVYSRLQSATFVIAYPCLP